MQYNIIRYRIIGGYICCTWRNGFGSNTRHGMTWHDTTRHGTTRHYTALHCSTPRYNIYSTTQHNTIQLAYTWKSMPHGLLQSKGRRLWWRAVFEKPMKSRSLNHMDQWNIKILLQKHALITGRCILITIFMVSYFCILPYYNGELTVILENSVNDLLEGIFVHVLCH